MAANSYGYTLQELKELADAYALGDDLRPDQMHEICEAFLELLMHAPENGIIKKCALAAGHRANRITGSDEYWKGRADAEQAVLALATSTNATSGLPQEKP